MKYEIKKNINKEKKRKYELKWSRKKHKEELLIIKTATGRLYEL